MVTAVLRAPGAAVRAADSFAAGTSSSKAALVLARVQVHFLGPQGLVASLAHWPVC